MALLNYFGAVLFLEANGYRFRTKRDDLRAKVAALQTRVWRKAIPHHRRTRQAVMFDEAELFAWLKGEPVPVKTNQKEIK